MPTDRSRFWVVVGTDATTKEAWPDFKEQQDADSFDARRANVMVVSDGGMTADEIEPVVSPLRAQKSRRHSERGAALDFDRP